MASAGITAQLIAVAAAALAAVCAAVSAVASCIQIRMQRSEATSARAANARQLELMDQQVSALREQTSVLQRQTALALEQDGNQRRRNTLLIDLRRFLETVQLNHPVQAAEIQRAMLAAEKCQSDTTITEIEEGLAALSAEGVIEVSPFGGWMRAVRLRAGAAERSGLI